MEALLAKAHNIDLNFLSNDRCDDFREMERFFIALDGPVRNPTNLGWMLAILRLAETQGRRILLSGTYGNYTISWSGWSQSVSHLKSGRLLTAYKQWRQFYYQYPTSRLAAFFTLFIEPLLPTWVGEWDYRRRNPTKAGPWQQYSAILPNFAANMKVDERATRVGHDFLSRVRANERTENIWPVDYWGDWLAANKAFAQVEVRDPTADIDLVSYCFGIPVEQFLVENIDRSIIRRAMWGIVPEAILTNRKKGLQSADWHEKYSRRHDELKAEITELRKSPLARRALDLDRLDAALKNWPQDGWDKRAVSQEYEMAFMRGLASGRFIRWIESSNRSD